MGMKIDAAPTFELTQSTDVSQTGKPLPSESSPQPINTNFQNDEALRFVSSRVSANQNPAVRPGETNKELTPVDFLSRVLQQQPVGTNDENAAKERLAMKVGKSPQTTTRDDYNLAFRRAVYDKAMDGFKLTDEEIKMADKALIDAGLYRTYYNLQGTLDGLKSSHQKSGSVMPVSVGKENIEYARRAGQAVLQYREYQSLADDAKAEYARRYATEALGGFVQVPINGFGNVVNGLTEPFRAGERAIFGTDYIPAVPRMEIAERSEYWNKDNRMLANNLGEIGATLTFGGMTGGRMLGTQPGRVLLGTESTYNIGAGFYGKDVTQTDENGNARQMPLWERGLRVTGGFFGARQTINAEIAAPNSMTNRATDKLSDIFDKPPTIRPQTEALTPEGFKIKIPQSEQPVPKIEDLTSEMRGRGGYESNELNTHLGTKMPKVRQPWEVTPSMKPSPANKPLGEAEKMPAKADSEVLRGLSRQNEAARTLAQNGYRVEQKAQITAADRMSNPWLKAEKRPDFKIEGEIFDAYAPGRTKSAANIREEIRGKVSEGQTRRIVLNMDDSAINLNDLKKAVLEKPVLELEQILVVKGGEVIRFFPFDR